MYFVIVTKNNIELTGEGGNALDDSEPEARRLVKIPIYGGGDSSRLQVASYC